MMKDFTKKQKRSSPMKNGICSNVERKPLRIAVMGAAAVGKTCIVNRFINDTFIEKHKATVEDFHQKQYKISKNNVQMMEIVDTTGSYQLPKCDKSFEEVDRLRQEILEERGNKPTYIVVVANKSDVPEREREVCPITADIVATVDWGCDDFIVTSAKDDLNITTLFSHIAKDHYLREKAPNTDITCTAIEIRKSTPLTFISPTSSEARKSGCVIS